jgi:hypothetical protein
MYFIFYSISGKIRRNFYRNILFTIKTIMARIISITSPPAKTDRIISELEKEDTIYQIQLHKGVSVHPAGDLIKVTIPNYKLTHIMKILDRYGLGFENGISASTDDPAGYIPTSSSYPLMRDNNEATWEEMEMTISNDSNTSVTIMIVMFLAGMMATFGIATNVIHIVVGGMLVAPGFMPISRIALGIVARNITWKFGFIDFLKGYLAVIAGSAFAAILLMTSGTNPLSNEEGYYFVSQPLMVYWTTFTIPSILTSMVAGIIGAVLIATKKTVFTSGVMIGLALIPTASLTGIAAVMGEWHVMINSFHRFIIDVAIVLATSIMVFLWIRLRYMKRDTAM